MRWFTWLMPGLGVTVLILGLSLNIPQKFQASTGWIGFFVFVANKKKDESLSPSMQTERSSSQKRTRSITPNGPLV